MAEATSHHLRLLDIKPQTFGSSIYLRFRFGSGDAMGMNMATIACDRVVRELIEPGTGIPCVALSGNFCVDKKPSAVNFLEGRGKRIYAEVVLDGEILERCLKSTSRSLVEVQYRKNLLGSIAAGSIGFNAHYANVLAAAFIATGQDVAQVVEGAMGVTCIEPRGDDAVFASVYLPDVPLGVVGGGTAWARKRRPWRSSAPLLTPRTPVLERCDWQRFWARWSWLASFHCWLPSPLETLLGPTAARPRRHSRRNLELPPSMMESSPLAPEAGSTLRARS